jgi:hypothetical protein
VRRALVGLALVGAVSLAGCSTSADSPPMTTHCPSKLAACGIYKPTPLSTTTTLPSPLALGATTTLSFGGGQQIVSGQFTVNRVWMSATPRYVADDSASTGWATLSGAVHYLLAHADLPSDERLTWVGVDLAIAITGNAAIELGSESGPTEAALYFVVNGGGSASATDDSVLLESGFVVGVAGCPFPFPPPSESLNPGQSFSGCVALALPVGTKVSTVGLDVEPAAGAPLQVAQWRV